jgi:hypothetical protein
MTMLSSESQWTAATNTELDKYAANLCVQEPLCTCLGGITGMCYIPNLLCTEEVSCCGHFISLWKDVFETGQIICEKDDEMILIWNVSFE